MAVGRERSKSLLWPGVLVGIGIAGALLLRRTRRPVP
jgi:hypothetical protein